MHHRRYRFGCRSRDMVADGAHFLQYSQLQQQLSITRSPARSRWARGCGAMDGTPRGSFARLFRHVLFPFVAKYARGCVLTESGDASSRTLKKTHSACIHSVSNEHVDFPASAAAHLHHPISCAKRGFLFGFWQTARQQAAIHLLRHDVK